MWEPPKLDWTPDDYYHFDDLNRVENNTQVVAEIVSYFDQVPAMQILTTRDMKAIEFADSLNRIEANIDLLKSHYKPSDWIDNKLNWRPKDSFSFLDANRLENNLASLYAYYKGNIGIFKYCGSVACGEGVI